MRITPVSKHYTFLLRIWNELKQENIRLSLNGYSLAGVLTQPYSGLNNAVLLLHPHPLYGGDKDNYVVKKLEQTFIELGFTTFRFDFRGVSNRSQEFVGITGAVEDTYKAMDLMENYELKSLGLVGYSFGGSAALRVASCRSVHFLVTLSASFHLFYERGYDESHLTKIHCPVLMFHGQSDRMVPYTDLMALSSQIADVKTVPLENESHFYERSFPQVVDEIRAFISSLSTRDKQQGYP
jgi:alpha/beta superfamily hydrolase